MTPYVSPQCSSCSTDLLLPVVRQGQVVVSSVVFLIVVHERVQVWKVPVQIDLPGVAPTHQVAVELWTLLTQGNSIKCAKLQPVGSSYCLVAERRKLAFILHTLLRHSSV